MKIGVVTREAPKSPVKGGQQERERTVERTEGGVITYGIGNNKKTIMYFLKDCDKSPRIGDHVKFNICQVCKNNFLYQTEILFLNLSNLLSNLLNARCVVILFIIIFK